MPVARFSDASVVPAGTMAESSARRLADMRARRELIAVHMIAPIRVVCAMDERTTRSTTSRGCRRSAIAAPMIEPNE